MMFIEQQALTSELKTQIDEGFGCHAIETIGFNEKFDAIAFVAKENEILAGVVVGQLFWGALHIRALYVSEFFRHKRLGTRLMNEVFKYGCDHKCPFAFVETMSFQALEFYKKMGFILEFTRTGYKHQTAFHYLRKDL